MPRGEFGAAPHARRLLQLTVDDPAGTDAIMDMPLGKKRASKRRAWLEGKGNLAEIEV